MKRIFLIFSFTAIIFNTFAQQTVSCIHSQVCRVAKETLPTMTIKEIPFGNMSDHHFHMTPAHMKKTYKANTVILPPVSLFHWVQKLKTMRNKNKQFKSISLKKIPGTEFSLEALGHFWLDPKATCINRRFLMDTFEIVSIVDPCIQDDLEEKEWIKLSNSKPFLLILTHDALSPFLSRIKQAHLKLKGSGHHETITVAKVKDVKRKIKSFKGKVIWTTPLYNGTLRE